MSPTTLGVGLICIIQSVSPSTLGGGGGGAHLHHPQCVPHYLGWRWGRGSSASSRVCLPLPWVEVGEGLICITHSLSLTTLSGGGGGAHLHRPECVSHYLGGGAHLHHPECVSLYLGWRWGRGSFASSTVCLPLPWVEVGEGLICITHSLSPTTLSGGGGGAHLHRPECVSHYLAGGVHLHHPECVSLYLGWRWGRGSFASSTVCLPLPWVEVGEGLICIIQSVSPITLGRWGAVLICISHNVSSSTYGMFTIYSILL